MSDVLIRVQRQFGDEAGAQVEDEDIFRWINDAQKDIARSAGLLQVTANTTVASGVGDYPLPASILTLRSVRYDGVVLNSLSINQAETLISNYDQGSAGTGTPANYWVWGGRIYLHPIPDNSTKVLKMFYVREPAEVTGPSAALELPVQFHPRIVEYCLAQAYELDNDRTGHATKMGQFRQGVNELVSLTEWQPAGAYPGVQASYDEIDY